MSVRMSFVLLSVLSLFLGSLFYLFVRGYAVSPYFPIEVYRLAAPDVLSNSFPSFVHSFSLAVLAVALGMDRKRAAVLSLVAGCVFELIQPIFYLGTFDICDVCAVGVGVGIAQLVTLSFSFPLARKSIGVPLFFFGLFTSIASSKIENLPGDPVRVEATPRPKVERPYISGYQEPVYMSYEELRASFRVEQPRPAREFGKILVLGSALIVSEPNVGVHIFDNSDPSRPVGKFFLNIPGNVDLASKDDFLYADSFVDLLVVRLSGEKPELVSRVPDTFEWNPYQVIHNNQVFSQRLLNRKLGVIVGSRTVDKRISK